MRVLVVEDDLETAQLVSQLLCQAGHEVEVALDGETALPAARANPPDVVLLDLGLPGMDGWQVARRVQGICPGKTPLLIALSGHGLEEDRRRSWYAGIDLHLVKPVDAQGLRNLLARF